MADVVQVIKEGEARKASRRKPFMKTGKLWWFNIL
jgi:hypothetical protein